MDSNSSSATQQQDQFGLTNILTSLQQGVVAINNMTNAIKSIFPSSS